VVAMANLERLFESSIPSSCSARSGRFERPTF